MEVFVPQFSDKYVVEIIVQDSNVDEAIRIIRENATIGKIFIHPVLRAIDIKTGAEDKYAI